MAEVETIEESYETTVRRKVVRTKMNIEEVSRFFDTKHTQAFVHMDEKKPTPITELKLESLHKKLAYVYSRL